MPLSDSQETMDGLASFVRFCAPDAPIDRLVALKERMDDSQSSRSRPVLQEPSATSGSFLPDRHALSLLPGGLVTRSLLNFLRASIRDKRRSIE